mmetsp:Transcript_32391/g.81512  ORF Transcript_32391/g.81512 Transcript_32391/m.81512 type:complete len:238 (-) Transcript_32391:585-1298(-)
MSRYLSRVSFMPLRKSATTPPGLHTLIPGCVAGGVAARNPASVRRSGSGMSAEHSVANSRALRATDSFTAASSASGVVDHGIAFAATFDAVATAAAAASYDMSSGGGTRRSKSSAPRRPVNQASRRSIHSLVIAADVRSICSSGGSTRATSTDSRSPARSIDVTRATPVPRASGSWEHMPRHASSHWGVCVQNLVDPVSTKRTTEHNAVAAALRCSCVESAPAPGVALEKSSASRCA